MFEEFIEALPPQEFQKFPKNQPPPQVENVVNIQQNKFPIQIEFENIEFYAKKLCVKKPRKILKMQNQQGIIQSGKILAVLGPSGSGKTTFLNILSNRITKFKGTVCYNGSTLLKKFSSHVGFVDQDYQMPERLTVKEYLMLNGVLKIHSDIPLKKKIQKINQMIEALGLGKCKNTLIGAIGGIGGISGGERKRVSICKFTWFNLLKVWNCSRNPVSSSWMNQLQVLIQRLESLNYIIFRQH
jgi:ABC-type lipoprotein export system ATPase subunit